MMLWVGGGTVWMDGETRRATPLINRRRWCGGWWQEKKRKEKESYVEFLYFTLHFHFQIDMRAFDIIYPLLFLGPATTQNTYLTRTPQLHICT